MKKLNILYVEDDTGQCEAFMHEMKQRGYSVSAASTAEKGLDQFTPGEFDAVICDLNLPGMSGLELLCEVRQVEPDAPFIVLTAHGNVPLAVQSIKEGASDFLLKPLEFDQLDNSIQKAVEARRLQSELMDYAKNLEEANRSLEDANCRLETLIDLTTNVIVMSDLDGSISVVNKAVTDYFGIAVEEILGQPLETLFDKIEDKFEDKDAFRSRIKELINDNMVVTKDDIWKFLSTSLKVVQPEERIVTFRTKSFADNDNIPLGRLISISDVTQWRQSTDLVSTIVNCLPNPTIVSTLKEGKVLFANQSLADLIGVPLDEVTEKTTPDFYANPDDRKVIIAKLQKDGFLKNHEVEMKRANGEILWMIFNFVTADMGGEAVLIGTFYEITERKKSEDALRESEERFRQLAENINEVFWMTTPDKDRMIYVSPKYEDIWGRDCDELYANSKAWLDYVHPDDRQRVTEALPRQVTGEYDEKFRIIRPDGTVRWLRDLAYPIRDVNGEIYRICGVEEDITDARLAEENMRLYRRIFMAASDAIVIIDPDGKVVERNPAHQVQSKIDDSDFIGKHISETILGNLSEEIFAAIKKTGRFQKELEFHDPDLKPVFVDLSMMPIYNDEDKLLCYVGMGQDISERKRDEAAIATRLRYEEGLANCSQSLTSLEDVDQTIKQALEHLRKAADVGRVYIYKNSEDEEFGLYMEQKYEICAEGVESAANHPESQKIPYDAISDKWMCCMTEDEPYGGLVKEMEATERAIMEAQGIKSIIVIPIFVNGEWYGFIGFDDVEAEREWGEEEIRLLKTAAEMIGGYFSRKSIIDALQRSEERFRNLVVNANDIIYSADAEGRFTYLSPRFRNILGYETEDYIGKPITSLMHPDDIDTFDDWLASGAAEGSHSQPEYEFRYQAKDGSWLWFVSHASVIRDEDDNPVEIIGVTHDITRMKQIHEEIERTNKHLKETQTQLVQSEKMASLGMLVAGIAHEINTPIGAISSMHNTMMRAREKLKSTLDTICGGDSDANRKLKSTMDIIDDAHRVIDSATIRVTDIVKRLRSFARLDEAEVMKIDIHEGIEDTLTLIQHEIKHGVTLKREFAALPMISCYPGRLNQVFLNLLVNAKQAIRGKGEITIRTYHKGANIYVEISDNGVGIPADKLDRIFDPGYTTKGVGVGTGLGLSICYQIMKEDHHGDILVRSEVNKGTTFTLVLPIERVEEDEKTKELNGS